MAKLNTSKRNADSGITTHEGGKAKRIDAEKQLRRSVMACMLWESSFYEEGVDVAERIKDAVKHVDPYTVSQIAIEARENMKMRHVPLMIVREMARLDTHKKYVAETLARIIQRPDEITEFMAIYWKEGKRPLSGQVKKGLAKAFGKFNEYQMSKWNKKDVITLKDALFLCHAKPENAEQDAMWKRLIAGELAVPDTWEVSLSAGKDKKETWERLLKENKLGALALLRNLRNMQSVGVSEQAIREAILNMKVERVLPYRFIAAAKYAPKLEDVLETGMFKSVEGIEKIPGKTVLLIDVSGSMDYPLSSKSDLMRYDAANGLAMLARELCEQVVIYTFSNHEKLVPPRRGFALAEAITKSQSHGGTALRQSMLAIHKQENYDRIIVITDEQSQDGIATPKGKGYVINVASYQNGVGYGEWTHIDGWSEATLAYIAESERR